MNQLIKYDFHDSLLENIQYDKANKNLRFEIDFCNWKQDWYKSSNEETSIIFLDFANVSNAVIPEFKINSDEIVEFNILSENEINIIVFNDLTNNYYKIIVKAENVKITK